MAKTIKFDLPIDGVKIATLDKLRDHFTTQIIGHFRTGLLADWLRSRGMTRELAAVEALKADDDAAALKGLCRIFEVEAGDDAIAAALTEATGVPGRRLHQTYSPHLQELRAWIVSATYYLSRITIPSKTRHITVYEKHKIIHKCEIIKPLPSKSSTKSEWVSHFVHYINQCYIVIEILNSCPDKEFANDLRRYIEECIDNTLLILDITKSKYESKGIYSMNYVYSPRLKSELISLGFESKLFTSPFEDDEE